MFNIDLLKGLLKNSKLRNIIILLILIFVFMGLIVNMLIPEEFKKSKRVLMCNECGHTMLLEFANIRKVKCPKCNKKSMEYCMKCRVCQFEFPYLHIPDPSEKKMTLKEVRAFKKIERKCPNCGELHTFPVTNSLWGK